MKKPILTWYFSDEGEAYDASQYARPIKNGDVLVTPYSVGFLFHAWPVRVEKARDDGEKHIEAFHEPTCELEGIEKGAYLASVNVARGLAIDRRFATRKLIDATQRLLEEDREVEMAEIKAELAKQRGRKPRMGEIGWSTATDAPDGAEG